jgi:hypothetical protein
MRLVAVWPAVAALLVVAALAFAARGSVTPAAQQTLMFTAAQEKGVVEREHAQDLLGYWGELKLSNGTSAGYYRARCSRLRQTSDGRIGCTIVVMLGPLNALGDGSVILEGMVNQPMHGTLFADDASGPKLAMTGGTNQYAGRRGFAQMKSPAGRFDITLLP